MDLKSLESTLSTNAKEFLQLDDLVVRLSEEWSSTNKAHRILIRKSLTDALFDFAGKTTEQELMDLNKTPISRLASASVSHSPNLGGFALAAKTQAIGIDIEDQSRPSQAVVSRISKEPEVAEAPDFASLWVAKEASFKALKGPKQPKLVSQIEITHWSHLNKGNISIYGFKPSHINDLGGEGRGLVYSYDCLKLGIATIIS